MRRAAKWFGRIYEFPAARRHVAADSGYRALGAIFVYRWLHALGVSAHMTFVRNLAAIIIVVFYAVYVIGMIAQFAHDIGWWR